MHKPDTAAKPQREILSAASLGARTEPLPSAGRARGRSGALAPWHTLVLLTNGRTGPPANSTGCSGTVKPPAKPPDLNWSKRGEGSEKGGEREVTSPQLQRRPGPPRTGPIAWQKYRSEKSIEKFLFLSNIVNTSSAHGTPRDKMGLTTSSRASTLQTHFPNSYYHRAGSSFIC